MKFKDQKKYKDRLAQAQKRRVKTIFGCYGRDSAIQKSNRSCFRVCFYGGLDGAVVGEKFCVLQSFAWRNVYHWSVSLRLVEHVYGRRCYL